MFKILPVKKSDSQQILELMKGFYTSSAVDHHVPIKTLQSTLDFALLGDNRLHGYGFWEDDTLCGFAYITTYFACEVGGICVQIEDIFISECCRGKGYGNLFFDWVFDEHKTAKRFRLEVTDENVGATRLYERLGFVSINYKQMVLDK